MTTYYVDGDVGSDVNDGLAEGAGNAWETIGHAQTQHAAGDIIYVKASATYNEQVSTSINGTTSNPVTYIGYTTTPGDNGKVAWTTPSTYCLFLNNSFTVGHVYRNFTWSGGTGACVGGNGDNMTYVNCDFTNATAGTSLAGTQATFIFCEASGNTNNGFSAGSGAKYYSCKSYNNGAVQINGTSVQAYKCVMYGHTSTSQPVMNLFGQSVRISACVIDGESNATDGIDFNSSSTNNLAIVDTVIQNTVNNAIENDFLTGMNYIEANCAFHNVGSGVYSTTPFTDITDVERVEADPLFTDDATGDYTLTEGSPLVGAGMTPGLFQETTQYNSIGAYDGRTGTNAPGAYEYFPFGGTLRHLQPRMVHKEVDLVHNELDIIHNELSIRHNR